MKHRQLQTPMFFGLYGGQVLLAQIEEIMRYEFVLKDENGSKQIKKTDIQFCYNAEKAMHIFALADTNETIKKRALQPIIARKRRYKIKYSTLKNARKEKKHLTVTMRGGEVFTGTIKWFNLYEIKLLLDSENDADLLLFRHAIYNIEHRSGD